MPCCKTLNFCIASHRRNNPDRAGAEATLRCTGSPQHRRLPLEFPFNRNQKHMPFDPSTERFEQMPGNKS